MSFNLNAFAILMFCFFAFASCESIANKNTEKEDISQVEITSETQAVQSIHSSKIDVHRKKQLDNLKNTDRTNVLDVDYIVLSHGSNRSIDSTIIRSVGQLEGTQLNLSSKFFDVDFENQAIIVASGGTFSTGGYSVELDSAVLTKNTLELTFVVLSPSPTDLVTQAFTYPYIVILVEVNEATDIKMEVVGASTRDSSKL